MPELTAEELEAKKKEEELASLQAKDKATQETLKKQQEDQATKSGELTDAQKLRIFEIQTKTVKDQGTRLTATENELAKLKAKAEEEPATTVEESAKKFYADPIGVMREEFAKVVAPLNAFKDRFESDTAYVRIKRSLMTNPVYAQQLNNPQFAAIIDELMAEGQKIGAEVSENTVEAAIVHTIGSIAVGNVTIDPIKAPGNEESGEKKVDTTKGNEVGFIPPYLAPSSPPQKKSGKEKVYRELTENEARLARERNMSPEVYLDWLEVDSADIIDSKIGMTEKKGA